MARESKRLQNEGSGSHLLSSNVVPTVKATKILLRYIIGIYYGFILQNCNEDADAIGIDTMTIRYFHKKVSKINPFRYSHGD